MASIEPRKLRDQTYSYRVTWRQDGIKQWDTLGDEYDAGRFKLDVEQAGNRWPAGWVRGIGYPDDLVAEAAVVEQSTRPSQTLLEAAIAHTDSKNTRAQPEHRMKMRRNFTRHLAELGAMPADRVRREHVQEWCDDLVADGKAYKTIKNLRSDVSTVYKFLVLDDRSPVAINPVLGTHIDADPDDAREPVFLQHYEYEAIAGFLHGEHLVYLDTLAGTGMRKGEALALRVGDVDLRHDVPAILINKAVKHGHDGQHRIGKTKTRAGMRSVTIDPTLADTLERFTRGRAATEALFPEHGNDGTWQRNIWVPAIGSAGLMLERRPRIHDLRHTHASWCLAEGMTLFEVSRRLGHAKYQTTADLYGHLDRSGQDVERLARAMPKREWKLRAV